MNARCSAASGSTYHRSSGRRSRLTGYAIAPLRPGRRCSGRSAETGHIRSACARHVARAPSGPAPPRRISSRRCSNSATASTSADGEACADAPSCPPPSGMAAWYFPPVTAPLASVRSRDARRAEPADARARARGRFRDVRARALPCPRAGRRARVRGLRPHPRARRGRRAPDDGRPRVPGADDDRGPHRRHVAGDGDAGAHSPPLRPRRPRGAPLPAQRDDPPRRHAARGDDRARPAARALSGLLLARGARVPSLGLRVDGEAQPPADRHLRARQVDVARAVRTAGRARPHDPPRHRPCTLHAGRPEREPFLLYPANRWPHKNHDRLFDAFALVRRERPELRLVLTGQGHDRARLPEASSRAGTCRRTSSSTCTAAPPASSSRASTRASGCRRSRRWRAGAPWPASNATSLPEVCGDAAEYFDPLSTEEMAAAILRALEGRLVERGLARAAGFTWDACARAHDAVYRDLSA